VPDRSLVEQNRALEQKLTQLSREVRTLRIRAAYSGAPRIAESAEIPVGAFDAPITLAELEVEPGKWLIQVFAQAKIVGRIGTEVPKLDIVTRDAGADASSNVVRNTAWVSPLDTPVAGGWYETPIATVALINVANRSTVFARGDIGRWSTGGTQTMTWVHTILIATPL
jgi:hypothetical protein